MNSWKVVLGIAKTHLISKMKSTVTATLGVTFGIGAYITLVSFMTGLNKMLDDLILNQTPHVHLYNEVAPSQRQPTHLYRDFESAINMVHSVKPKQNQQKIHNALPIISYLKQHAAVKGATPQLRAQIFYLSGAQNLGGNLLGVDIMEEERLSNIQDYIIEGSPSDLENNVNGIILGAGLVKKMSLRLGNRIQVRSTTGSTVPLKIVGIYQSGIADIDDIQSYANLSTVQNLMGEAKNYITDINVKLHDLKDAPQFARQLEHQFDVKAVDVNEANAQFETGSTIRNLITYSVSVTLLIVAGFGIYNILNMLIYEKMKDIAILKATGFSGTDVLMIFMSQALIIGALGGVLGLLIGFGLSNVIDNVAFETEALPTITTYPINYNPVFYLIGISFAMISTTVAGFLPSQKAKKMDPVTIIRGT